MESLALTSSAEVGPSDPPLPPTLHQETPLKRDEWMLMGPGAPTEPASTSRTHASTGVEPLTEDYGDAPDNPRTLGGGVDFFSDLGTERKKKPRPDVPDPEKVRPPLPSPPRPRAQPLPSRKSARASSTSSSKRARTSTATRRRPRRSRPRPAGPARTGA